MANLAPGLHLVERERYRVSLFEFLPDLPSIYP